MCLISTVITKANLKMPAKILIAWFLPTLLLSLLSLVAPFGLKTS